MPRRERYAFSDADESFDLLVKSALVALLCLITFCKGQFQQVNQSNLPAEVIDILTKDFSETEILGLSDLEAVTLKYFTEQYPHQIPGMVSADFDGNGLADYALLLKGQAFDKNNTDSEARILLVVFMQMDHGKFTRFVLNDEIVLLHRLFLRPVRKGKVDIFINDTRASVSISFPAFEYVCFEAYSTLFFWDGKGFSSYVTGF